jgi:hypothetical protein
MDFIIVCLMILSLFALTFGFYVKIFIIDFPQRDELDLSVNNWDAFDIAIHYLNYALNKYWKKNYNSPQPFIKGQIPAAVSEQWTSIWHQANRYLTDVEEAYKKDLEVLIINMKSKAIDIGLFKYNTNQMRNVPRSFMYL